MQYQHVELHLFLSIHPFVAEPLWFASMAFKVHESSRLLSHPVPRPLVKPIDAKRFLLRRSVASTTNGTLSTTVPSILTDKVCAKYVQTT